MRLASRSLPACGSAACILHLASWVILHLASWVILHLASRVLGRSGLNWSSTFRANVAQAARLRTESSLPELCRHTRRTRFIPGSGVISCSSGPPFHVRGALWLPWGCPWSPFGSVWVPLASPWPSFGSHLGSFGRPLGPLWPCLGPLWPCLGSLGAPGSIRAPLSEQMLLKHRACAQNLASRNSAGAPGAPGSSPDQVSSTAARDLPSTRAGGQKDVSSKQTPSKYE